eukprot:CAMPEP_0167744062 /NCGR_PEP_ID=MMETSP0110_2-20121227/2371_1 /TAXON_ID=629695 /ORGANISM="Gymnochlora sp., Strain CCMP2014" /LENGTH=828 /DNA_ID=CAMNT_0007628519 /DNA_START=2546 /DNA_END=5032 /DNA_ORIENTATION=-
MQAFSNKLLAVGGKGGWPPSTESILKQGVLVCIAVGIPIAGLLYDSQKRGSGSKSESERQRISGIIRAMLKQDKRDHVACKRILNAIRDAKEVGISTSEVRVWREELGRRIASTIGVALEEKNKEALKILTSLMDKEPYALQHLPRPLMRRLRQLEHQAFIRRLKTVWNLIIGPARVQLKWILLNVVVGIANGIVKSLTLTYYIRAAEIAKDGKGGIDLLKSLLATLVIHILNVLLDVLQQQCANRGAGEISVQLQRKLFATLLTADCASHEISYKVADKIYLLREAATLDQKLLRLPIDLATAAASLAARYYTLGKMSTRLLVACGLFVPVSSWLSTKAELWSTQQREVLRHRLEWRRATDARILGGQLLTVRAFVQEKIEAESFEKFLRYKIKEESKACVLSAISRLAQLLPLMGRLGALLYGSQLVSRGWMTKVQLEEFVIAHDIVNAEISSLKTMIPSLWAALEPAAKIVEVLNMRPSIEKPLNTKIQDPEWMKTNAAQGELAPFSIEFKDVWFSYPSRPNTAVLRGVSFRIEAGTKVAIVGYSGSGKSTVLALVQRFYEISKGQILIDGKDIRDYDPRWLRRHIAVVSQRSVVFPRDVISNISLGGQGKETGKQHPKTADVKSGSISHGVPESIRQAAKTANAADFIENLPEGYHTQLGEGGIELSGGQQQRIAIARAIDKKPSLLLLDEAFANLDASSEEKVLGALKALVESRPQTVVTVAHQLSTIAWSDVIICMTHGRVEEMGSHKELMKKKGIYSEIYAKQTNSQLASHREKAKSDSALEGEDEIDIMDEKLPDLKLLRAFTLPVLRRARSDVLSLCGQ